MAGPVSTVQLANFRRGLQDHQYLTLARKMGLDGVVDAALAAVVPRVFSDAKDTVGFAETGDAYEAMRRKVAEAIAARGAATATTPAPGAGKAGTPAHPRLLVAERDPFSGLPALRARWAAASGPGRPRRLGPRLPAERRRELRPPRGGRAAPRAASGQRQLEPLPRHAEVRPRVRLALRLSRLRRRAEGPPREGPRGRGRARAGQPPPRRPRAGRLPQPLRALPVASRHRPVGGRGASVGRGPGRADARQGAAVPRQRPRQRRHGHARRRLPRVDGLHADHVRAAGDPGRDAEDDGRRRSRAPPPGFRPYGGRHLLI